MDKAIELLRELAGKLGQTVESLWPEVVAYNAVFAITTIFGWLAVVAVMWGIIFCIRKQPWFVKDRFDCNIPGVKFYIALVALIITFISFAVIAHQVPVVINPVGYVVQGIINGK